MSGKRTASICALLFHHWYSLVENRVGFHPPAATGLVSEKELIHPVTALKTLCDVTDRDFLVSKVTDSPSCRYGQNISST